MVEPVSRVKCARTYFSWFKRMVGLDDVGTFVPSISLGFDTTSYENATSSSNSSAYFVGLNWADMFQPDDKIGFAFGKPTTNEDEAVRAGSR